MNPLPNFYRARHTGRISANTVEAKPAANARDQWRDRFAEHARSGFSIKHFCKDHGIAGHSFYA